MRRFIAILSLLLLALATFGAAVAEPGNETACANDTPREQNKHCDDDGDGVANYQDRCRHHYDPSNSCTTASSESDSRHAQAVDECQIDTDGDTIVDCDDPDDDNDGVPDAADNCRKVSNSFQEASDDDGSGDACDGNDDGDRFYDEHDNCPQVKNNNQRDINGDGEGDACDSDIDGDGYSNDLDNCPYNSNGATENDPVGQSDTDHDGVGDACDDSDDLKLEERGARLQSRINNVLESLPKP